MVLKWTKKTSSEPEAAKPASEDVAALSNAPMPAAKDILPHYGKHVFTGSLADHYLKKNGGSGAILEDSTWVSDRAKADIVAAAVLEW